MKRVACCALLLVLSACGSDASPDTAGSSTQPSSQVSSSDATTQAAAAEGNPVDGAAFCEFLARMEPRLKAVGTPVGAEADLTIELATWIGDHSAQKPRTASDLDDASQGTCPKTRTNVLASLGADSFSDALG
jgi:hypothetical protein